MGKEAREDFREDFREDLRQETDNVFGKEADAFSFKEQRNSQRTKTVKTTLLNNFNEGLRFFMKSIEESSPKQNERKKDNERADYVLVFSLSINVRGN